MTQAHTPDTIVAISTPPGRGGIGIVRLSGPAALTTATRLLHLTSPLIHAHATYTPIPDPRTPGPRTADQTAPAFIDDALVTAFFSPHSYTGEDLVEIAAHGSPVILSAILRAALALSTPTQPIRLATPGEFTQRAFLSGRLDLTQAEAVHDLIAAQTLDQARTAAQQLGGALSRRIIPAKETLLHLIALLEAGMDFASGELDDVDVVPPFQIATAIAATITPLQALAETYARGRLLREGATIALIGPPNAGKSSLFNRLLQRERAIVTATPGTTRDTVEESLALGGIPLRLIDTAGLRDNTHIDSQIDEAEQQGIARTRVALADADLILLVHDVTQPVTSEERTLATSLANRPHLTIENKIDLLDLLPGKVDPVTTRATVYPEATASGLIVDEELGFSLRGVPSLAHPPIQTSALTSQGLDTLRSAILAHLGATSIAETAALNNLRQLEAITATLAALNSAAAANSASLPHELILVDLHAALNSLDSLTGATTPDDILARIFSTFCIGK